MEAQYREMKRLVARRKPAHWTPEIVEEIYRRMDERKARGVGIDKPAAKALVREVAAGHAGAIGRAKLASTGTGAVRRGGDIKPDDVDFNARAVHLLPHDWGAWYDRQMSTRDDAPYDRALHSIGFDRRRLLELPTVAGGGEGGALTRMHLKAWDQSAEDNFAAGVYSKLGYPPSAVHAAMKRRGVRGGNYSAFELLVGREAERDASRRRREWAASVLVGSSARLTGGKRERELRARRGEEVSESADDVSSESTFEDSSGGQGVGLRDEEDDAAAADLQQHSADMRRYKAMEAQYRAMKRRVAQKKPAHWPPEVVHEMYNRMDMRMRAGLNIDEPMAKAIMSEVVAEERYARLIDRERARGGEDTAAE